MSRPPTLLTSLGFAPSVDDLYQVLRGQTGRDLDRVAASLMLAREELAEALRPLLDAGVARVEGDRLVVEPPTEVLRIMVAAQAVHADRAHRRLDRITAAVALLAAEEARGAVSDDADAGPLEGELVTGGDIHALVRSVVLETPGDLLWLRPDQWRGAREPAMAALVREALEGTGRASRAIYPVRAAHEAHEALAIRAAAGEQVRVVPDVPTRLLVVGDSVALLPEPLGLGDRPLVLVRQRSLVDALRQWFELQWERAAVPSLQDDEPRPDLRAFLLQQLGAGARDDQIARKLGVSLRTVRRRVAELMIELGVDSRFQAGVEAARRGWL